MQRELVVVLVLASCGDNKELPGPDDAGPGDDAAPDAPVDPFLKLTGTGLCDDAGCMTINPDVREYVPKFQLYADGATKKRWMQIPAGTQIDTGNMDRWVFPVGTKFWKEFTRDGTRVETRFITKTLDDDDDPMAWKFFTYQWNATQDDTTSVTAGVMDANGTPHNIPSRGACKDCHDSLRPSRVLGFQAIQLDYDAAPLVDLETLIADGTLTVNPTTGTAGDRFTLPGTATDQNALGYLHANCGHCHNPSATTHDVVPVEFGLEVGKLASVAVTPAFVSAVGVMPDQTLIDPDNGNKPYPFIIVAGNAADSGVIFRMNTSGIKRMPKVAVETPDTAGGIALLTTWINSL